MPVYSKWDNDEQTIYRVECAGTDWAWNDFSNAVVKAYKFLGEAGYDIDFIMQFGDWLPEGNAMAHMKYAGKQPANIRRTVIVNRSGLFIEMLIKAVDRIEKWEGPAMVKTLEEAHAYLATPAD